MDLVATVSTAAGIKSAVNVSFHFISPVNAQSTSIPGIFTPSVSCTAACLALFLPSLPPRVSDLSVYFQLEY